LRISSRYISEVMAWLISIRARIYVSYVSGSIFSIHNPDSPYPEKVFFDEMFPSLIKASHFLLRFCVTFTAALEISLPGEIQPAETPEGVIFTAIFS
jgi:hypothetical protein